MSKYHLMHCLPHPSIRHSKMHGLNGYLEVIQSIEWGLKQLGHEVSYGVNNAPTNAINIIFGAQVLPIDFIKQLPKSTIIYNFEQIRGVQNNQIKPAVQFFADKFQIWDYSADNMDAWKRLGNLNAKVVPVGYAPTLTRIPKADSQDIDVLIYGLSGDKRLEVIHRLSQAGIKVMFVSGLYGEARDALIARSKLVLNINLYDFGQIFEIVRVSYLLANKKAVVATLDPNTSVEQDFIHAVKFTSIEKIVDDCIFLLDNDSERSELEISGFEAFAKRDIREILKSAIN